MPFPCEQWLTNHNNNVLGVLCQSIDSPQEETQPTPPGAVCSADLHSSLPVSTPERSSPEPAHRIHGAGKACDPCPVVTVRLRAAMP